MSTCIIIDDEPLARSIVVEYLMSYPEIKILAECSVIKPLTSSDSASAKSKGGLLVSAIEPTKNIKNKGNNGRKKHQIQGCY